MMKKILESDFVGNGPIKILYPGTVLQNTDTGIGSIGRIDHALFQGSTIIPMHPHINDEILTYLRSGKAEHKDSEGFIELINNTKLMLMQAGSSFYHEEKIIDEGEALEGLQIFIRPKSKDLKPKVVFRNLKEIHSINKWRLLASCDDDSELKFSSDTWVYDLKMDIGTSQNLPTMPKEDLTFFLYVFKGEIIVNGNIALKTKNGILIQNESIEIDAISDSKLVLFVTDENAEIFKGGMYSGNKK
jgi:hypothetical protein